MKEKVPPPPHQHNYHYYGQTWGNRKVLWPDVTEMITNEGCPTVLHGLVTVLHNTADVNATTFSLNVLRGMYMHVSKAWGKLKQADDNHYWFRYISYYQLLFLRKYLIIKLSWKRTSLCYTRTDNELNSSCVKQCTVHVLLSVLPVTILTVQLSTYSMYSISICAI